MREDGKDCKYFCDGDCNHPYKGECQHNELWTPNWFDAFENALKERERV